MIPVILDTDLGSDIDDHWAVAMILGCPELDVRLITTASGDTVYRAQLLAGLLNAAGRTEIPIGIGPAGPLRNDFPLHLLPEGAAAQPLDSYPGTVLEDGVGALIDAIMSSPEPMTVIAIGPVTNLAAALDREPAIVSRSRVVSMAAYLRGGVHSSDPERGPQKEYNVIADIPAFARLLDSAWDLTLAPIDTCGDIVLTDDRYARIRDSSAPLLATVIRDYREWYPNMRKLFSSIASPEERSSILFDTLAVYLAYDDATVDVEDLLLTIDDDGVVAESPDGRPARVAITWKDLDGFYDHLIERLEAAAAPAA